ncbi:MAG: c-type cytochrome [Asticcacaulis sp.]|nr:c-type cytochrome [Asticcacaulis sp.]
MKFAAILMCLTLSLILPACSNAGDVAAGKAYFDANCALCHDASSNAQSFEGPPLFGIAHRKAGPDLGRKIARHLPGRSAEGHARHAHAGRRR